MKTDMSNDPADGLLPRGAAVLHTLAPCAHCPFRRGQSYLHRQRAAEIALSHLEEGGGARFHCHETTGKRKKNRLHCAGALLFALANGVHTQAMQLGERSRLYRLDQLRGESLIYRTFAEMVEGHRNGR